MLEHCALLELHAVRGRVRPDERDRRLHTAPAYEPVAMRWASRLAWAPVNEAVSVVEMSEETPLETSLEALSAPGSSMRQPPKATAAIVRPIVT